GTQTNNFSVAAGAALTFNGTYTFSAPVTISGAGNVNLLNGTLTVAAASQINAPFTFSNGTLNGAGDLTVGGAFSWTGGTMGGSGKTIVAATSTLSLSGTSHNLGR